MQVRKKNYLFDKQPISDNRQNGSGQEYNSEIYSVSSCEAAAMFFVWWANQ